MPTEAEIQADIDRVYAEAVMKLRILVAVKGLSLDEALKQVTPGLGLSQIAQIHEEAKAHYAKGEADLPEEDEAA